MLSSVKFSQLSLGQAEILEWETDGMLLACGPMVGTCIQAATMLRNEYGMRVGVINARFVKPLDRQTICKAIEECGFVLTIEEASLMGGFGSAVLELANDTGLSTAHVRRLGLPDRFVLHAEREEQLAEVGLDIDGIIRAAFALARAVGWSTQEFRKHRTTQVPLAHTTTPFRKCIGSAMVQRETETQVSGVSELLRNKSTKATKEPRQNKLTVFLHSVLTRLCRTRSSFKGLKRGTQRWRRCWTNACADSGPQPKRRLTAGVEFVQSAAIGMSPNTIVKGLAELAARRDDPGAPLEARLEPRGAVA